MPQLSIPGNLFGKRLRDARSRAGIAQDKLGVMIGMDEGSSSARISRYETGIHEPPFAIAEKLADALRVPVAYFYCGDDQLARLIVGYESLTPTAKKRLVALASELGADF